MPGKVNVLGTEYTIIKRKRFRDKNLENADGYCDDTTKEIVLPVHEPEAGDKKNLPAYWRKVLRHEIIHAFLSESGLAENSDWATNEEFVDWIAIQGPKLWRAWEAVKAVD